MELESVRRERHAEASMSRQSPSKRSYKLEDWANDMLSESDERHKSGYEQKGRGANPVGWALTWILTMVAGFVLSLTILSLLDNVPLNAFERKCPSTLTQECIHGIFTWAQTRNLKTKHPIIVTANRVVQVDDFLNTDTSSA